MGTSQRRTGQSGRTAAGRSFGLAALAMFSAAAQAQAQPAAAAEPAPEPVRKERDSSEMIVTGTRIPHSTFESPSPVTIVNADLLAKSSPSTLAAALNNLPALVANGGPNATAGQRTAGRNTLNLRGIGTGRTLTLVNGRRFPGSQPGGAVDTNLIPQGLVSRVEVVTGGASAAYGSDAVAGVVNFILDTRFKGLKLLASAGLAEAGDGFEYRAGGTYGTTLGSDRLHLVVSGEYFNAEGIAGDARPFRRQGANLIPNPAANGTAANPNLIVANQARVSNATAGGFIASLGRNTPNAARSLVGQQFLPGGVLASFDRGVNSTATLQDGGDGINTAVLSPITRPLERATIHAGLDFEANDRLTLFVNGGYGYSRSSNAVNSSHIGRFGAVITGSNPFLPAAVRTLLGPNGSFTLNRYDLEYEMAVDVTNHNLRLEAGFTQKIGGLTLEVSGSIGSNVERALNSNNFVIDRYAQAVDVILVNGQPACRNPANGCVPVNPFGFGSYTPEMIDWFTDTSVLETRVDQKIVQANIGGELFDGVGAGPWVFALGAEYRHDDASVTVDPISEALGFFTNNFRAWSADRSVREAFVEVNAPLLRDVPGAALLEFNGAFRRTNYTFSGSVNTWKLATNYSPVKGVRLRASYSQDIRAPNQAEMFTRGRQTSSPTYTDRNPASPDFGQVVAGVLTSVQGNPGLVPEVARTLVFGMVIRPEILPGLNLSLDRFDIRLRQAIGSLSGQDIIDQCHIAGFVQACDQIVRNPAGRIVQINNSNFNLDQLRLTGWDFEGRYVTRLGKGQLSLRTQISMLERLTEQDFQNNRINRVGETQTPKWRALGSIGYEVGALDLFLQGRYIGNSLLNVNWTAADSAYFRVPAAVYLDGQLGVKVGKVDFALNIQNLLDKPPVFAPQQDQFFSPTNPNVFDQIGRTYRISVRSHF